MSLVARGLRDRALMVPWGAAAAAVALGPKTLAEIWAAVYTEDDDLAPCEKILDSFKSTQKQLHRRRPFE